MPAPRQVAFRGNEGMFARRMQHAVAEWAHVARRLEVLRGSHRPPASLHVHAENVRRTLRGGRADYNVEHADRASRRGPTQYRCRACLASGARAGRDSTALIAAPPAAPAELSAAGLTWIHLDAPSLEHAQELAERFGWHPLDVEDVMSKRQRPKIDDYADEGYLFGVLHFPIYDRSIQRLNAAELDVFVGPDYLVTLPTVELLPITRLFRRCEEDDLFREQLFSKGSGRLLYEVLDDLFDYCFPILDKIGHKLDSLEDDVFEGRSEEVVRDISNAKQEIISYRKIIKPERSTLRLLERHVERFLPEELELYFDDVVDATERIWDILDNYKEVVEALESTNESVISHRQNDVLRILTVFSVILLPLTLITGFFGMNLEFPGYDTAWAFWTVFGLMIGALAGILGFFRYKRWL